MLFLSAAFYLAYAKMHAMPNKWARFSRRKKAMIIALTVLVCGYLVPENFCMPVKGAGPHDYHAQSFWYYPWGKSGTHKGVDIFAKEGTPVLAATGGMVLYSGTMGRGGNVLIVLGPHWKLHYYAHLREQHVNALSLVSREEMIGTVGTTGNARGKPPHLHYSIARLIPLPWKMDSDHQGWKKMFYVNPIPQLNAAAK